MSHNRPVLLKISLTIVSVSKNSFQCETGRVVMERSYPVRMEFNYLSAARELSSFRYEVSAEL